jgi:arylsulfatase A-like enzyme
LLLSPALRLLLRRFSLLLGLYLLLRLGFYVFNYSTFQGAGSGPVLLAFWHGFRFDIAALLWLNLPLVLASLLVPVTARRGQLLLRGLYVTSNVPGIVVNVIDWEYFKFIGRRTSSELTTIGDDVLRQASQMLAHYWYLLLLVLGLAALLWWLCPMPSSQSPDARLRGRQLMQWAIEFTLVSMLVVLGVRGGLQLKPLRPGAAFEQQPAILGHLALNSTFTLLKTFDLPATERLHYFASETALRRALQVPTLPQRPAPAPPPANVVVLLLESFGSEYTGVENGGRGGYTPFFDSLATHGGILFRENYANGRRSIEALPAVLAGLPSLLEEPFITSTFQTNEVHGLGETLARHGYTTAMYHGATNGTMGFDMFAGLAGMQRYYGLNQYPQGDKSPDYDGHWGIFDEPYLQYFNRQLTATRQPFFATLFTLSAHDPFTVPAPYRGKFLKGTEPIHPTIAYTDMALRRFFATASRQPWYANTVFILTADHTSQSDRAGYQNTLGHYKTPLLIFRPGQPLPAAKVHRITSQTDVPATVLDVLGLQQEQRYLLPFSQSAFDTTGTGRAVFSAGGSYFLVHSDFVTELQTNNLVALYPYRTHFIPDEPLARPDPALVKKYGDELRALLQFYVNGLVDNRLYK